MTYTVINYQRTLEIFWFHSHVIHIYIKSSPKLWVVNVVHNGLVIDGWSLVCCEASPTGTPEAR